MNILLTAINAKFIHSSPAVELLRRYAEIEYDIFCETAQFTVNQSEELILTELYRRAPELLGFSCYIWNFSLVRRLIPTLRKILPLTKILLGGPEVSYGAKELLAETGADFILCGEGEEPFSRLCLALQDGTPLDAVPSLCYRTDDGEICQNPMAPPLSLAKLPFLYEDISRYQNQIIYYEAQRGCPFQCQYCLSSVEQGVRFQPLEKVKAELLILLQQNVRQVKFIDRTFNANLDFAMEIWRFLSENDNGITNFHFELEGGLLTDEALDFLCGVRPGLFQFEIGIQSTCPETLRAIRRQNNWDKLLPAIHRLKAAGNIHLHLDLIAGLPYESYDRFGESFDAVYALAPNQFQLGFLKLLRGSGLRRDAAQYGICYRDEAPYEVLFTDDLRYDELLKLKEVEELLDRYYNSGRFTLTLAQVVTQFASPFAAFEAFSLFCRREGAHLAPLSEVRQHDLLYRFGLENGCDAETLRRKAKFDLCLHEKPRKLPDWAPAAPERDLREQILGYFEDVLFVHAFLPEYEGLEPKQIYRLAHIEFFPFDPISGEQTSCAYLFNYRRTDANGNAVCTRLPSFS